MEAVYIKYDGIWMDFPFLSITTHDDDHGLEQLFSIFNFLFRIYIIAADFQRACICDPI